MLVLDKATITGTIKGIPVPVPCMFNPNNYTMKRTNSWVSDKTKTSNSPKLSFSSGGATTLDMELFFDTYEEGTDVRLHTEPLWLFMRIDEDNKPSGSTKGQPPTVVFAWGLIWFFEAVITSLTEKFTLFLPSGIPVRSTVTVTFKQLKDPLEFAFTNPTSGGGEPQRIHVVQAGERLDWIAYREYGDSTMWRIIAQENGLIRPRSLRPGQKLIIPAL